MWCVRRVRAVLALLLLGCWGAVPALADAPAEALPDSATLRERVARAYGAVPDNYRDVIVGSGTLGAITTTTLRSGADSRVITERGISHTERGRSKGENWHQDANGLTVIDVNDPGNAVRDAITTTVKRVHEPVEAYVISSLDSREHGTRQFIDPVTYHTIRLETVTANGTAVSVFDAFGPFGTRTLATHWTYTDDAAKIHQTYTRTVYQAGTVKADELAIPPNRQLVHFPDGVAAASLPVHFARDRAYVMVTINGRGVDLLLDTGASGIVLNACIARGLGLTLQDEISVVTAQRYTHASALVPHMSVGPVTMDNVVVSVAPVADEVADGVQSQGLLGFDFLAELGVTIDYEHHTVTAVPAERYVPPADPGTLALDVRLSTQQPMTSVTLDGAVAERFLLDTGGAGTFLLFDYFARRYPDVLRTPIGKRTFLGVGGPFQTDGYRISDLVFASIHFKDFIGYRVGSRGAYAGDQDGLIGTGFLRLFTLGLDYSHGRVYLTPNGLGRSMMHSTTAAPSDDN